MSDEKKDWHILEFFTPISENAEVDSDFYIKGTAINETVTHNNHKYVAEELKVAAPGMIGRPLLVDHDNRVESIKGKVTNAFFDYASKSIKFEAKVMDKTMKEMIRDGRISSVSIGAFADDLIKEDDGSYIAKGLKIVELSLVAVPADEKATFASAMANSIALKESLSSPRVENTRETSNSQSLIKEDERRLGEMTEELSSALQEIKAEKDKLMEELNLLKKEKRASLVSEYRKLCTEKKVKEKDVSNFSDETVKVLIEQLHDIVLPVAEEKKEMKSVVSEKSTEIEDAFKGFMVERSDSGRGYTLWAKPDSKGRIILNR